MRNLTIKREKSFVACLVKIKVYIEDRSSAELVINGTPCSKLGELKNGEEKTFRIGDGEVKVFVIADEFSKDYSNEFYLIPEGTEDVKLTGKNKFNPASGNAFHFDNNDSPEVTVNRKKGARTGFIILIVAVIIGFAAGFIPKSDLLSDIMTREKVFSDGGMTITLTDAFEKVDFDGFTATYGSRYVAVFAMKESFADAAMLADYTISEYANLLIEENELTNAQTKTDGGLTCVEYTGTADDGTDLIYFTYIYKTYDAFWFVQFATPTENAEKCADDISSWASSVSFTK